MSAQASIVGNGSLRIDAGFAPAARGTRARAGVTLRECQGWSVLVHRKAFLGDPLRDLRGRPGLWRAVPGAPPGDDERRPGAWSYVFEIPPGAVVSGEEGEPGEHPPVELLDWARATSGGTLPEPRDPLPPEEIERWLEPTRRHVRAGSHLAALELCAGEGRLALRVPALVRLPADLSPARRAWLHELVCDAQQRWRLVRFGLDDECVGAEVDLSGAPADYARALFDVAFAALTTAAAWVLPGLATVADGRIASRLLDRPPSRDASRTRPTATNKED